MAEKWRVKLASKERCVRVVKSFGAWHKMIPYLTPPEQVALQGQCHWTYDVGVPRAQTSIPLPAMIYFPVGQVIYELSGLAANRLTQFATDIESYDWVSIQVRQDIFQVHFLNFVCRLLKNTAESQFRAVEKAPMNQKRKFASYRNMKDRFIFATGGRFPRDAIKGVERYDIAKDVWEEMPKLNTARQNHSSCVLGTTLYVFFGYNKTEQHLDTVEKLETRDLQAGWQLIRPQPTGLLAPRFFPIVAAVNSDQIIIVGGTNKGNCLADAFIFNTESDSVKPATAIELTEGFNCFKDQCMQVRRGVVVAVVETNNSGPRLIEYKNGTIRYLLSGPVHIVKPRKELEVVEEQTIH